MTVPLSLMVMELSSLAGLLRSYVGGNVQLALFYCVCHFFVAAIPMKSTRMDWFAMAGRWIMMMSALPFVASYNSL